VRNGTLTIFRNIYSNIVGACIPNLEEINMKDYLQSIMILEMQEKMYPNI